MTSKLTNLKTIMIFGLVLIIGIWIAVWQQINFDYNNEMEEAARQGMNLARIYEEHVKNVFHEADKILLALREAYQREGEDGKAFQVVLGQVEGELARTQIGITDPNGMARSLLHKRDELFDSSERDYYLFFHNSTEDRMFVGKTIFGRQSKEPIIPLSRRYTKSDGSFGGVFFVSISPQYLLKSFEAMELGPGKIISVTGIDGFTRIRQGADVMMQTIDIRAGSVYSNAVLTPSGIVRSPNIVDGVMRINAYRVIPDYNVYINVAVSEEDVLRDFEKRKKNYLIAAALSTFLVIVFCGALIRKNLEQQELEKHIKADASRLLTLYKTTSRLVTGSVDTDSLLETIVRDTIGLVNATNGLIATVDPGGNSWTVRYGVGIDAKRVGEKRPLSEGLVGQVIRQGELIYIENYSIYKQRLTDGMFDILGSVLALPLKVKNETLGVLTVEWTFIAPQPDGEVLNTISQYAYLASVALEQARNYEEIQRLAYTDALTGLPNRLKIHECLEKELFMALEGKRYGAVFFLDLDNLKLVNDTMGHSCGDNLIVAAGRQIIETVGEPAIVGRLAGDEFVIILPEVDDRLLIADMAENLVRSLDRQYRWEGSSFHVSATAGVALYPDNGTTVEEILKNADAALYVAKNKGKHSWQFYDASIQKQMHSTILLSNGLRQALECDELSLNYQPILSPEGLLAGFEALLRWNSPDNGAVSPAVFIPIAEQDGRLIRSIGTWVIREACKFARRLADLGYAGLRVDVNVSACQIESDEFVDLVMTSIRGAGIAPSQLGLEITESVLMESVEQTAARLQRLRVQGIVVSLDDFGEGYSSLSQLLMLPVDALKISRSLVSMQEMDDRHFGFVSAIVNMAKALSLKVVAEGVETEEQLAKAKRYQCDYIQGYYFYRPMTEAAALKLVESKPRVSGTDLS